MPTKQPAESIPRIYLAFCALTPKGGMADLIGVFDTLEDAMDSFDARVPAAWKAKWELDGYPGRQASVFDLAAFRTVAKMGGSWGYWDVVNPGYWDIKDGDLTIEMWEAETSVTTRRAEFAPLMEARDAATVEAAR